MPMTQDHWKALTPKQKWDILVALRGPDLVGFQGSKLKWMTSAVIRGHMWSLVKPTGGSAMVNSDLPGPILPTMEMPAGWGQFDGDHFLGHIQTAAVHMGLPILWVTPATFKILLEISFSQGINNHLQYVLKDIHTPSKTITTLQALLTKSKGVE